MVRDNPDYAFVRCGLLAVIVFTARPVVAVDISGVQPTAFDQPQIYSYFQRTPDGPSLGAASIREDVFPVQAFVDTGASGIILSESYLPPIINGTADLMGVTRERYPGPDGTLVVFQDVGLGGNVNFNVSETLYGKLAPFPVADYSDPAAYSHAVGPFRAQIGPLPGTPLPYDVIGMPAMRGSNVVFDPKPLNRFALNQNTFPEPMRTYLYAPGTPFDPAAAETSPGIPATDLHVALSYGVFDRFTHTDPAGAPGPTQAPNPVVGPDPVRQLQENPPADDTPGVTVVLGDRQTTGSFLLDTGAANSFISAARAAELHVRYQPGTQDTGSPLLERFDPDRPELPGVLLADQFQLSISGIGGESNAVAGFFSDALLLRTMEGDPLDDDDPNHLRFLGAPLWVHDISMRDPVTDEMFTPDGVLGMNYLVASAMLEFDEFGFPLITDTRLGPFDWVVFDEPGAQLEFALHTVPIPPSLGLLLSALGLLALLMFPKRRWRLE